MMGDQRGSGSAQDAALARPTLWVLGIVGLTLALIASGMLIYSSFSNAALPGCGQGGGCDQVYNTAFGRVPGTSVSAAVPGFAFFASALIWWLLSPRGVSPGLRWYARFGALASITFLIAMFVLKGNGTITELCKYCLASHIGNFIFVFAAEVRGMVARTRPATPIGARAAIATLLLLGVGIGVADGMNRSAIAERENRAFEEELRNNGLANDPAQTNQSGQGDQATPPDQANQASTVARPDAAAGSAYGPDNLFTGRYLYGPEKARARIVIFSDYQCPDCKKIEDKLFELLARYPNDVNFSAKHAPADSCNPYQPTGKHPSACEAAVMAEAAGLVGGADAFYKMHVWLFGLNPAGAVNNQSGNIDPLAVQQGAAAAGIDATELARTIAERATNGIDQFIGADMDETQTVGLYWTPMLFVNGREVKNFRAFNYTALERAVQAVLASDAVAKGPGGDGDDRPLASCEKFLDDFYNPDPDPASKAMGAFDLRPILRDHPKGYALGEANAPIQLHFWGDVMLPESRKAALAIRDAMRDRSDIRLIYHHYVFNSACNPSTPVVRPGHEQACAPAMALEAAGIMGGNDAYWKMFDWLIANVTDTTVETDIIAGANAIGLDGARLQATMRDPSIAALLAEDGRHYKDEVKVPGIPGIVINGYRAIRVEVTGCSGFIDNLLERALEIPPPAAPPAR